MQTRLSVLGLLAAAAACAQPASIFRLDPLDCFQMDGPGVLGVVPVDGPGFIHALHIQTPPYTGNFYDIRARCFSTQPAAKGDILVATFWMRTISAESGAGRMTFVIERGRAPWTKSVQWTTQAGFEWEKKQIALRMAEDYPSTDGAGPEGYNVGLWVTFEPQEIEIGGLTVVNYGRDYPLSELGLELEPYDGHAPDAPWRAEAAARIERHRKADITAVVEDGQGRPVAGAKVRLRMKRHAFPFGSAVSALGLLLPTPDGEKYRQAFLTLFNAAVLENDLKWPLWENGGKDVALPALEWLGRSGMVEIRGHNLIWPSRPNLPADVAALLDGPEENTDALRSRIFDHFTDILGQTQGRVAEWDVVNEPVTNTDVQDVLGEDEIPAWFQHARALDPAVKLYLNDFGVLESAGYNLGHQKALYERVIPKAAESGALDGIGLQAHFEVNPTAPERVLEVLDRFAELGKELKITEFDITTADEQLQADYTRDFLTAAFSHPAVTGIYAWGFYAGAHWSPPAAMIREDWTPKPNYHAWMDLVYGQWWTDVTGETGSDGRFQTRGFLGDYELEITAGGRTERLPFTVGRGSNEVRAVMR